MAKSEGNAGAARFRRWRDRKNLTQHEVAKLIQGKGLKSITPSWIGDLENSRRMPYLELAVVIATISQGSVKAEHWLKRARKTQRRAA
jgi:transcriptional regulator with XRE-family HTH domain